MDVSSTGVASSGSPPELLPELLEEMPPELLPDPLPELLEETPPELLPDPGPASLPPFVLPPHAKTTAGESERRKTQGSPRLFMAPAR